MQIIPSLNPWRNPSTNFWGSGRCSGGILGKIPADTSEETLRWICYAISEGKNPYLEEISEGTPTELVKNRGGIL